MTDEHRPRTLEDAKDEAALEANAPGTLAAAMSHPTGYSLDDFAHIPAAPITDADRPRPPRPDLDAAVIADDGIELAVTYTALLPPKIANESAAERSREVRAWINYAMDMFVSGEGDLEECTITVDSEVIEDASFGAAEPIEVRGQQFIRIEGPHVREALRAETRADEAARRRAEQVDPDSEPRIDVTTSGRVQTERTTHADGTVTYRSRRRDPGPGSGWGEWMPEDDRRPIPPQDFDFGDGR